MPPRSRKFRRILSVLCLMTPLAASAAAQPVPSRIERIDISPAWAGSASTTEAVVTISNRHGVFKRTWKPSTLTPEHNSVQRFVPDPNAPSATPAEDAQQTAFLRDTVARQDVLNLIRALTAPPLNAPSLSNLGINQKWLEQQAGDFSKNFGSLGEPNDERQQAYLRKSFTDPVLIEKTIPHVVGSSWTDDGVWVHVSVRFVDGMSIEAETRNQPSFMLPWTCETDGKKVRTFNANISRAVAKLLPEGSVNKARLAGEGLMREIVFQMDGSVTKRWKEIGAEDKAGTALDQLRKQYLIRRSEVSEHIGLHFGPPREEPGVENLEADVRLPDFPQNLVVAAVFKLQDGHATGVDTFLEHGSQYERLVLDNPWIMSSLKQHPNLGAWLIYVGNSSMSEKAMNIFAADMHALGRDDLAQEVSAHRTEIADLSYYGNEVLLFPDHHAILWRWDPSRDLFGWRASLVKAQECTDYPTLNVGCSAAVVGPDGHLEK
jgi:hypothetical protein